VNVLGVGDDVIGDDGLAATDTRRVCTGLAGVADREAVAAVKELGEGKGTHAALGALEALLVPDAFERLDHVRIGGIESMLAVTTRFWFDNRHRRR